MGGDSEIPSSAYVEIERLQNARSAVAKHLTINENPDSIEIGSPSKGGAIKIYGNFNDLEAFKAKVRNAKELRTYAQTELTMG